MYQNRLFRKKRSQGMASLMVVSRCCIILNSYFFLFFHLQCFSIRIPFNTLWFGWGARRKCRYTRASHTPCLFIHEKHSKFVSLPKKIEGWFSAAWTWVRVHACMHVLCTCTCVLHAQAARDKNSVGRMDRGRFRQNFKFKCTCACTCTCTYVCMWMTLVWMGGLHVHMFACMHEILHRRPRGTAWCNSANANKLIIFQKKKGKKHLS